VGQTSTEAKREVEQTRAHLGETLEALQLRAKRNLDVKTQLQTNRALQAGVGALVLIVTGVAVFGYRSRRRRTPAEEIVRKLKLNDLRDRLNDFRNDARAWTSAQKRIVKADKKSKVEVQSKESIGRRLLISALEAALTALATGYARRLVSGSSTPHERGHAAVSKKR
jgi:predicted patatin/cPLA2 family phospholipase